MRKLFLSFFYLSFTFIVLGQSSAIPNYISIETANSSDTECTYSYAKIVPKADALYDEQKLEEALDLYKRALSFRKNDEHVIQRIRQIESISIEKNREYVKIVKKADECFDNQQYEKALELYKRAHLFRKKDTYVIKRIRETKQKIRQSNRRRKYSSSK